MSFITNLLFGTANTVDPTGLSGDTPTTDSHSTQEPIVEGVFYPRTLSKFNGHDDEKIFIAVKGIVYDCTQGRQFYGPSGPYSNFAGHDASRGLALNSFDFDVVPQWDDPMDPLDNLTQDQQEALDGWEQHFINKYPTVGTLAPEPGVNN